MMSQICGHRGAARYAPENTLSGFLWCYNNNVKWSECDVQLTSKGTAVIIHDQTINRTTNSKGLVYGLSDNDLEVLDAGFWKGRKFKNERIPTLKKLLNFAKINHLGINIELKFYDPIRDKYRKDLVNEVARLINHINVQEQVLISSFDLKSLFYMRACIPELSLGVLFESLNLDWYSKVKDLDVKTIHLDYEKTTPSNIRDIVKYNLIPFVYTCNSPKLIKNLWDEGLGGVITDDPITFLPNKNIKK